MDREVKVNMLPILIPTDELWEEAATFEVQQRDISAWFSTSKKNQI